jgi:two-component system, sensor histidine kinase LadS
MTDVVKISSDKWTKSNSEILSFGNTPRILWIKCNIVNLTKGKNWTIVFQYTFSERIDLFINKTSPKPIQMVAGVAVPWREKSFPNRLDIFHLNLEEKIQTEIYIRYESNLTKSILLEIMPAALFKEQERLENIFYTVFSGIIAFFLILNLTLAVIIRKIIPIYYSAIIISYFLYQQVQYGFGPIFLFSSHPEWNSHFISVTAGITIALFYFFTQNLLSIKKVIPKWNLAVTILIFVSLLYAILSFPFIFSASKMQIIGRILYFISCFVNIYIGIRTFQIGYRPVIYFNIGFITIILTQTLYFAIIGNFFTKGAYLIKFLLPIGQFFEFIFFFIVLFLKLKQKNEDSILQALYEKDKAKRRKKKELSRTQNLGIERIKNDLLQLMEIEKIYCDEDLDLKRLADMLEIRSDQLSEFINLEYKKNFNSYLNDYRIKEAKRQLLLDRDRNILSIAFACGYNSKSTFNTEFKKRNNLTPKEFRNRSSKS